MQNINSDIELRAAIVQLEIRQAEEGKLLKEQFHLAYESMKPINLIKSTLREVAASGEIKDDVINASVGMTAGYITKAVFQGVTRGPFRNILGTAVMFGVKNIIARNPDAVKSAGQFIFQRIFRRKEKNSAGEDLK
jgi:hypothetical protein